MILKKSFGYRMWRISFMKQLEYFQDGEGIDDEYGTKIRVKYDIGKDESETLGIICIGRFSIKCYGEKV